MAHDGERPDAERLFTDADLDGFGDVNRQFGSDRGDEILAGTATAFRTVVPDPGTVYRYGSDEFLLLLPGADGDAALAALQASDVQALLHAVCNGHCALDGQAEPFVWLIGRMVERREGCVAA